MSNAVKFANYMFSLFPRAKRTDQLDIEFARLFEGYSSEVLTAVIRGHKAERKGNDPCYATLKRTLGDTARQFDARARPPQAGPTPEMLLEQFGHQWFSQPNPPTGVEIGFQLWLVELQNAGMPYLEARTAVEELTGCPSACRKYDGLDKREMASTLKRLLAGIGGEA